MTTLTFHWHVGDDNPATGHYEGYDNLDRAILRAYTEAHRSGAPVTVFRAEGPDDDLTFTPLAVVSPPAAKETP